MKKKTENTYSKIIFDQYDLLNVEYEDAHCKIWRVKDLHEERELLLSQLKKKVFFLSKQDIIKFKSEMDILAKADHPNILKIYGVGEYDHLLYTLNNTTEGNRLSVHLAPDNLFDLFNILVIIKGISRALSCAHYYNIIHGSIEPDKIWLKIDAGNVSGIKLSGFGIFPFIDLTAVSDSEAILKTVSYLSPEAVGIINSPINKVSDIYSLGVLFYQLCTGRLPFYDDTVEGLMHKHIANSFIPPSLINKNIPPGLDNIIARLLQKDQDKRYQNIEAFLNDLEGMEENFKTNTAKTAELCLNTSFIGRRGEINTIKKCIKDTLLPRGQLLLISGESGSGKTRLVDEFKELIDRNKMCAIFSRCFPGVSKIPYSSIYDIFDQFNTFYLHLEKEKQQAEKARLLNNIGHFGQILLQVNNKLSSILGEIQPLIELEPEKEKKRFYEVCAQFLCSLGSKDKPFIVFIDDLQWIDEGSLVILNEIMPMIHKYPFLIAATYRTEDIDDNHIIQKILKNNNNVQLINLENLHYTHLRSLLSELLNTESDDVLGDLTGYIMNQGKGNPLFSIELAKHLFAEGVIYNKNGEWKLNWENVDNLEIPSSLIDFILKRIKLLSENERDLLSWGAVIGSIFSRELLQTISNKSMEEIEKTLNKAFQLQLIGERMLYSQKIRFSHNKIHDAFNNCIDQQSRKNIHYKIALFYEEKKVKNESDIFLIANHYIKSGDKSKILEFALKAGDSARSKYANEAAIRYYRAVKKILEKNHQKGNPAWIITNEKLADMYLLTGNSDKAITIVNNALPYMKSKFTRAVCFCKLTTAFYRKGDFKRSEEFGKRGLNLLGEYLPTSKKMVLLRLIKELAIHILYVIFPFISIKGKKSSLRKYQLVFQFYYVLNWTYILSDIKKFICSILRMFHLSEVKIGKSKQLAVSYIGYAGLCMAIPFFKRALRYHNKALILREELHEEYGIAESLLFLGFCYEFMGNYEKSIEYLNKAMQKFMAMGDMEEYGRSLIGLVENYYLLSDYRKALSILKEYHTIALKSKDNYSLSNAYNNYFKVYFEIGNMVKAERNLLKGYEISRKNGINSIFCLSLTDSGRYYLEQENIPGALSFLMKAETINKSKANIAHYIGHLYNVTAEAYIADFLSRKYLQKREKKAYLNRIRLSCRTAIKRTRLWPAHYGGALRVCAQYYSLIQDQAKAIQFFLASIEHNRHLNRKYELAKSYFEYGKYLKTCGEENKANEYLSGAYHIFNETGSKKYRAKTEKILHIYPANISFLEKFKDRIRLASIINMSQKISSILDIQNLLHTIIKEAISITGATYGGFYILDGKVNDLKLNTSIAVKNDPHSNRLAVFRNYIARAVFDTEKNIFTQDVSKYKKMNEWKNLDIVNIKSIICLLIKLRNKKIGVFYIDSDQSHSVFSEDDVQLLNVFLSQAAISLENAELYKESEEKVEKRTQQLQKTLKDLEISNSDLQNFVYIVSHDLKEPLRMVSGFIQLLAKRYKTSLDENANEFISFAVDGANRMTAMIEDLLKYSRVGKQEKAIGKVDCEEVVNDTLKNLSRLIEEHKVKIFKEKLPVVTGYRTLLIQLFQNLIENAIKFCTAGIPVIHIKSIEKEQEWQFEVEDNGIGIEEACQEKVFQIFKRIDKENKYPGTGIGLALCKKIVEQHHGTIWIESELGAGSTFYFTIGKSIQ